MKKGTRLKLAERILPGVLKRIRLHYLIRPFYQGIGTILMFHRIRPKLEKSRLNKNIEISPEYLEQIILYFKNRDYVFVSLDTVHDILTQKEARRKKFVSITLDDGYRDNIDHGYPVFKKHNIPFTIYVATSFLSGEAVDWAYLLEDLITQNETIRFQLDDHEFAYECPDWMRKKIVFLALRALFKNADLTRLKSLYEAVFSPYNIDYTNRPNDVFLDWESVKEVSKDPLVTFGAHTVHHLKLSLLDRESARNEMHDSKTTLESVLGKPVSHFCFPFSGKGDISSSDIDLASDVGFKTSTIVRTSNIFRAHKDHLMALPRLPVFGEDEDVRFLDIYVSGLPAMIANRFRRLPTIQTASQ